jgi:hypothetical protein
VEDLVGLVPSDGTPVTQGRRQGSRCVVGFLCFLALALSNGHFGSGG